MTNLVGQSVKRVEDKRFITGKGRYVDDMVLPDMTHAVVVRSDVAHANIRGIDAGEASRAPGVVAVLTGADMEADGIAGLPCGWQVDFKNGDTMKEPAHPALAVGKVRHVGDAVAVVVAETREQAADAAELVEVDYEELPAVVDVVAATQEGAPQLFDDVPNNIPFDWELGDKEAADAGIAAADHVTTIEFRNQRLIPNAIEPRAAIGDYDDSRDHYTLYTTSQNPHVIRLLMSAFVMGIPEHKVRVVSPDVGGGFGSKIFHYAEEVIVTWASRRLGRPVKWTAQRSESFVTDAHGRDHATKAEMGFDADGRITALRVDTHANLGAYLSTFAPCVPTYLYGTLLQGLYTSPAVHVNVTAAFTTTVPVDALRGAGRPEATYVLERLLDQAAHELGQDPAELRRKNLIPAFDGSESQPGYETQVALVYDSGDYGAALDKVLEMVDYPNLRREQEEARAGGPLPRHRVLHLHRGLRHRAVGGGRRPRGPRRSLRERQRAGAAHGQGDRLRGQPLPRARPRHHVLAAGGRPAGHPHGRRGDRPRRHRPGALRHGHLRLAQPGRGRRGDHQVDREDQGEGRNHRRPPAGGLGGRPGVRRRPVDGARHRQVDRFRGRGAHGIRAPQLPGGARAGAGVLQLLRSGQLHLPLRGPHRRRRGRHRDGGGEAGALRRLRRRGQRRQPDDRRRPGPHGGVTHGIGQALMEGAIYDDDGQLINGSYMDYALPRADELPRFETDRTVTPCPHNPLGVKGAGETGTIGATPAVVNAVIDALWPLGVRHLRDASHTPSGCGRPSSPPTAAEEEGEMIPSSFEYHRPASLDEAVSLLQEHGEDASLLAGGHSLLPAMKLRLSAPEHLVDIGRIDELREIRSEGGDVVIGAGATHRDVESSGAVAAGAPLLARAAAVIGDVQVRNAGTIGGSLAHADPAADYPAAVLASEGSVEVVGAGRVPLHRPPPTSSSSSSPPPCSRARSSPPCGCPPRAPARASPT